MTKLNSQAKSSLESLNEKHLAYTIAKTTIESELKKELNNRLSSIRHERNMALKLASDAGVPKTQLGKAIGTSNYRTVQEILADIESMVQPSSNQVSGGSIEVETNGDGQFLIVINNFGDNSLSGSVLVSENNGELTYIAGEAFVLPQVYRAGYEGFVLERIKKLS